MTRVKSSAERPTGRPRISEATKDRVVEMYNADELIRVIAETCGISDGSVYRIIRERRQLNVETESVTG